MNTFFKMPPLLRCQLWALIVLVDFDYSRLRIADAEILGLDFFLWLEDEKDMISSVAACLKIEIPLENLVALISPDKMFTDSFGELTFDVDNAIDISVIYEAADWFTNYATPGQQKLIRNKLLSGLLTQLIEERLSPSLFQMA